MLDLSGFLVFVLELCVGSEWVLRSEWVLSVFELSGFDLRVFECFRAQWLRAYVLRWFLRVTWGSLGVHLGSLVAHLASLGLILQVLVRILDVYCLFLSVTWGSLGLTWGHLVSFSENPRCFFMFSGS